MNAADRQTIRRAIDQHTRAVLFTTDTLGKTILKPQYRSQRTDSFEVAGVAHGTHWAYAGHGCRCVRCSTEETSRNRVYKARSKAKKEAA